MSDQLDLLDYPNWPGFRARDTSKAAADGIAGRAATLRERACALICAHSKLGIGMTADECAADMEESILSVRPRVAELARMGMVKDSGSRRKNASGKAAIVWVSVKHGE
jgi:hypothetical protein